MRIDLMYHSDWDGYASGSIPIGMDRACTGSDGAYIEYVQDPTLCVSELYRAPYSIHRIFV